MDESFEEEENVFEQTTSAALHHVEDVNETAAADNNVGVPDEVDEHDDEGPGSSVSSISKLLGAYLICSTSTKIPLYMFFIALFRSFRCRFSTVAFERNTG